MGVINCGGIHYRPYSLYGRSNHCRVYIRLQNHEKCARGRPKSQFAWKTGFTLTQETKSGSYLVYFRGLDLRDVPQSWASPEGKIWWSHHRSVDQLSTLCCGHYQFAALSICLETAVTLPERSTVIHDRLPRENGLIEADPCNTLQ
jgi:hypothetical protein